MHGRHQCYSWLCYRWSTYIHTQPQHGTICACYTALARSMHGAHCRHDSCISGRPSGLTIHYTTYSAALCCTTLHVVHSPKRLFSSRPHNAEIEICWGNLKTRVFRFIAFSENSVVVGLCGLMCVVVWVVLRIGFFLAFSVFLRCSK